MPLCASSSLGPVHITVTRVGATREELQDPTTHQYKIRPVFYETSFTSAGPGLLYADNPSFPQPPVAAVLPAQALNPIAKECLSIAEDGMPEYPRSDAPSHLRFAGGLPKGHRDPFVDQPARWRASSHAHTCVAFPEVLREVAARDSGGDPCYLVPGERRRCAGRNMGRQAAVGIVAQRLQMMRDLAEVSLATRFVIWVDPMLAFHLAPEGVLFESGEIADDLKRATLDTSLPQRTAEMMMVDEEIAAAIAGNRWDRVICNEMGQTMRGVPQHLRDVVPFLLNFNQTDGYLGRPQFVDVDVADLPHAASLRSSPGRDRSFDWVGKTRAMIETVWDPVIR